MCTKSLLKILYFVTFLTLASNSFAVDSDIEMYCIKESELKKTNEDWINRCIASMTEGRKLRKQAEENEINAQKEKELRARKGADERYQVTQNKIKDFLAFVDLGNQGKQAKSRDEKIVIWRKMQPYFANDCQPLGAASSAECVEWQKQTKEKIELE